MQHPGVRLLHPDEDGIAVITSSQASRVGADFVGLINAMGNASSRAQGLAHTITTYSSFVSSQDEIYILVSEDRKTALGFVKIGPKRLFLWDRLGEQHELQPICLLDFFTYPSEQRKGYGRKMIDRVCHDKKLEMRQIPIDRPSTLCLAFMKKHFGLSEYLPQANNFVVFEQFWGGDRPPDIKPRRGEPMTPARKPPQRDVQVAPHAATPGRKRTGLNPITWQPYDY